MTDHQTLVQYARRASDNFLSTKLQEMNTNDMPLTPHQRALIQAGAERLDRPHFPTKDELEWRPISKGELAEKLYPAPLVVDMALPQTWMDRVRKILPEHILDAIAPEGIQFHFVTVYDNNHMTIRPLTRQGIDILAELATTI